VCLGWDAKFAPPDLPESNARGRAVSANLRCCACGSGTAAGRHNSPEGRGCIQRGRSSVEGVEGVEGVVLGRMPGGWGARGRWATAGFGLGKLRPPLSGVIHAVTATGDVTMLTTLIDCDCFLRVSLQWRSTSAGWWVGSGRVREWTQPCIG